MSNNEDAMLALAKSNSSLAAANQSLAASNNALAEAILKSRQGGTSAPTASTNTDAAETPAPAKGKGGRKSQAEKDAAAKADVAAQAAAAGGETKPAAEADPFGDGAQQEADPFGDGAAAAPREYTAEDIRAGVLKVREEKGGDAALAIIKAVGASALGQIDKSQYAKVAELCKKEGVTI